MGLCSQKLYMAAPVTSTRQLGKLRPRAKRLRARVRYQDQAASAALSLDTVLHSHGSHGQSKDSGQLKMRGTPKTH